MSITLRTGSYHRCIHRHSSSRTGSSALAAVKADVPEWVAKGMKKQRRKKKSRPEPAPTLVPVKNTQPQQHQTGPVGAEQVVNFERDGHVTVRRLIDTSAIESLQKATQQIIDNGEMEALRHRVRVLCPSINPSTVNSPDAAMSVLEDYGNEPVGFLQFFNSWKKNTEIRRFLSTSGLAEAAAELLGCKQVRLYQDCIFLKRPGMYETNWHSDVRLTPIDTNDFLTFWIPLRPIAAKGDSALEFAQRSHRDMAALFWRDPADLDFSMRNYRLQNTGALEVGDVSVHHGWTLHNAPGQAPGTEERVAFSVSFFADGARVLDWKKDKTLRKELQDFEDFESFESWYKDLEQGGIARHKDMPILPEA